MSSVLQLTFFGHVPIFWFLFGPQQYAFGFHHSHSAFYAISFDFGTSSPSTVFHQDQN
jgi:hypothetical protein